MIKTIQTPQGPIYVFEDGSRAPEPQSSRPARALNGAPIDYRPLEEQLEEVRQAGQRALMYQRFLQMYPNAGTGLDI